MINEGKMNNIKITVNTVSMHNITKSLFHKIERFYNLNLNSNYKGFVKGIRNTLIKSGDIVLERLGDLQTGNNLTIEIKFDKWKHVKVANFDKLDDYEKVEITFKYKNGSYDNLLYKEDDYNFRDEIKFDYFFKSVDYCNEINNFITGYTDFINSMETSEIFFQRELSLLRTIKFVENSIDRKVEVANYFPLSIKDLQYVKVKVAYEKIQDFLMNMGDHNLFKMTSTKAIQVDDMGLAIKLKLNTQNELVWCLSCQGLTHEMYYTDVSVEKNSEFRNYSQLENHFFLKALSEAGFYKKIDFSEANENNWKDYIKMIDLMNY